MKRIVLLGASGSIGSQTIDVVLHHKDEFSIVAVSVGKNIEKLKMLLAKIPSIQHVCVADEQVKEVLRLEYPGKQWYSGDEGLQALAGLAEYDIFVDAVVGFRGLLPALTAIANHKVIALANKESLVAGGPLVKAALAKHQVPLYPIDSEHSAIFQCLQGNTHDSIDKLIITASGGSFRDLTREQLQDVSVEAALHHPNWNMGGRITIDSATMMNKGFEVIEAHYLFDIPYEKIDVLIHRESAIHSMVQFQDHAIIAQIGTADMRLPIQYALSYPQRLKMYNDEPFDFGKFATLHFEPASMERYPLLKLAFEVGKKGGNLGAIMNAADEEAVRLFLNKKIAFLDIETSVIKAVEGVRFIAEPTLQDIIESDAAARRFVKDMWKGAME
ncbi:1-deoxy-D-xylulose-5-phosphate reductoisomerase [Eubacterium sp. TF05-29]|nr:1-deoxy-D-xylulose-5-phosphate reductoisomerase [Eubacterium sp. TF05-29]